MSCGQQLLLYDDEISDMSLAEMPLLDHIRTTYILEVGRYIENVVDISLIPMYRYIRTLDIVFRYIDIDIYRISDKKRNISNIWIL